MKTSTGVKAYGTTRAKAVRQKRLLTAIDNGWKPESTEESRRLEAEAVVQSLLETGLERSCIEPTTLVKGKTRGKFKLPRNWLVRHAIKL